jgi:hypothetical protein
LLLKSEGPFVRPTSGRASRVLDLQPPPRAAGLIGQIDPFRDDALAAELAGVPEDDGAVAFNVFVELKAIFDLAEEFLKTTRRH